MLPNFELNYKIGKFFEVRKFGLLDSELREWVLENYIRMIENPTNAERQFEQILLHNKVKYEKQVFFKIGSSCYFIDFYIPAKKIAIEIDGFVHKSQKRYDSLRNNRFSKIGIQTVRLSNSLAVLPNVIQYIESKIQRRLN